MINLKLLNKSWSSYLMCEKGKNMKIRARPKGLIFVLIYKERETKQ